MYSRPVTRSVSAELRARSTNDMLNGNSFSNINANIDSSNNPTHSLTGRESNDELILRAMMQAQSSGLMDRMDSQKVDRMTSEELFQTWLSNMNVTETGPATEVPGASPNVNSAGGSYFNSNHDNREDDIFSGELASLVANYKKSLNEGQNIKNNDADNSLIGNNWIFGNHRINESQSNASNAGNQALIQKLNEIARREELKAEAGRSHSQNQNQSSSYQSFGQNHDIRENQNLNMGLSPPSMANILSKLQPATPVTRSKSSELRQMIAAAGSSVPSTDEILQCLAKPDLATMLANLQRNGNLPGGAESSAVNQLNQQSIQNALIQHALNSAPSAPNLKPNFTKRENRNFGGGNISSVVSMLRGNLEKKKSVNSHDLVGTPVENSWNMPSPRMPPHQSPGGMNRSPDPSNGTGQFSATNGSHSSSSAQQEASGQVSFPEMTLGQLQGTSALRAQLQKNLAAQRQLQVASEAEESLRQQTQQQQQQQQLLPPVLGPSLAFSPGSGRKGSFISGQNTDSLMRTPSVNSSGTSEGGNPSKRHRVERAKKMMEAKERNSNATKSSSDVEALRQKCEKLEREVRSMKQFQGFMNRKDSEQTTQIEELEAKNAALVEERDRLIEEVEMLRKKS